MTEKKVFVNSTADGFIKKGNFSAAAKLLLQDQKKNWNQLTAGYNSLDTVEVKSFQFNGFNMKVQFNPGRIISSSAKVDAASIKERKCFLCMENLPAEQKGILYNSNYLILVNPFPIFPEHFTIPHLDHTPQQIEGNFGDLLKLTKDLSESYMVFYNGPRCGASAPDHFHFQAGSKGFLTIEDDYSELKSKYGEVLLSDSDILISAVDDGLRRFITFESFHFDKLVENFEKFYGYYKSISNMPDEPMMNILCYFDEKYGWRVIIFLRSKHRSSHYFAEDDKNILLSAASVDLGGVCILPLEKDFIKITREDLEAVFSEINISIEIFDNIKLKIKG